MAVAFWIPVFISIIGNAGYTKTLWSISGEPILSAIQQWSYQSFGAVLVGVMPSYWWPAFSNWPRSDGSLQ